MVTMRREYITVSAKIRRELWSKLKKYGVNFSDEIRKALEKKLQALEEKQLREKLKQTGSILENFSDEEIVELVRESRDRR